jgi:hypothetical protein
MTRYIALSIAYAILWLAVFVMITDTEILRRVFEKAQANGWKHKCFAEGYRLLTIDEILSIAYLPRLLISEHDFAKYFFGDTGSMEYNFTGKWFDRKTGKNHEIGDSGFLKFWEYHRIQMLCETEPLKYLERFLEDT